MRRAFVNGRIISPAGVLDGKVLLVEDGKILGVANAAPEGAEIVNARGLYLSPGFIDMHLHGGGGHDFMDGSKEAFRGAALSHLRSGTTTLLPTTVACADEELRRAFDVFASVKDDPELPRMPGLHLEGPYLSVEQKGAIDPAYIKTPAESDYGWILERASLISRVSVAPELPGAFELGDKLSRLGILVSAAHSDAELDVVEASLSHGFRHVTHLYSAMSMLRRKNAYRILGLTESAYLLDALSVEIIADGCHLPPELLRLILKLKPRHLISLVTDASRGAGLPDGEEILLGSLESGRKAIIRDGVAFVPDFSCFAGSVATADRCVRTLVQKVGLPVKEAVELMTVNPARVLGLSQRRGSLAPGMDADIALFDDEIRIKAVYVAGECLYKNT